jgi:hypothetical protein
VIRAHYSVRRLAAVLSAARRVIVNQEELRPCGLSLSQRKIIPPLQGQLIQQCTWANAERPRELLDHGCSWIASASFNVADIGAMDVRTVGIILLAPSSVFSEASYISAEANAYIHSPVQSLM